MKIICEEVYVAIRALEARKEWIEDDKENMEELPHIISLLKTLKELRFEFSKWEPLK